MRKRFLLVVGLAVGLTLAASLTSASLAAAVVTAAPRGPAAVTPATVRVYFPKTSDPAFDHVYSVTRYVTPPVTATYAVQLVIAGPTLGEQSAYHVYSEVNEILTGFSNCQHRDFKITLNQRGPKPETGTATLQFCRETQSPGIGADARITTQITATMRQFSSIKKVVILTRGGHCLHV